MIPRNQYTSKRAQRIDWVREFLKEGLERRRGIAKQNLLNKDALVAVKYMMALDGIKADNQVATLNPRKPRKTKKEETPKIRLPKFLTGDDHPAI